MNIADPFKQLVERKLWPIALLLVAALVAVPFLLAKPPEDGPLPAATAAVPAGQAPGDSVVSLSDPQSRDDVRAVLGARKDPFRPAQLHRVEPPESLTDPGVDTTVDSSSTGDPTGSTGGTGVTPDVDPIPVPTEDPTVDTPEDPKPTYDLYSLQVRFGLVSGELTTRNVKRLTGLPGGTAPAALYLGLTENRQSAVFIVDAGVQVVGDGRCDPAPDNCQTLILRPGETVFLTRGDKQWELDLIEIHTTKTTDAGDARRSRADVAKGGRRTLKRFGRSGGYRYSKASGTLRKLERDGGWAASGSQFLSGG